MMRRQQQQGRQNRWEYYVKNSRDAINSRYGCIIVTAGNPETLETLAAKGTPTAVGTAATAEFLATARIPGKSTAARRERTAGPIGAHEINGTAGNANNSRTRNWWKYR
jgi:hypothetical protein